MAIFYLAPVLGVAALILFVAVVGRYFPIGQLDLAVYLVVGLAVAVSLIVDRDRRGALIQCAAVGIFGIVATLGIIVPIFKFGTLNVHNDGFTYMAISDWLQSHAFGNLIPPEDIRPATSQVAVYQRLDLRIGASYLMALLQSVFRHRWAFDVYPLTVSLGLAVSGLAVGFPAAAALRRFARPARYLILTLPVVSLGGPAFAAAFGFMPQLFGVALGAAALFLWDGLISAKIARLPVSRAIGTAFVVAMLIAASIASYPEFTPLLAAGFVLSALIRMIATRSLWPILILSVATLIWTVPLSNIELIRAWHAIETQRNAVVGGPVDWGLVGFLAHALGIHGGAWDGFQWSLRSASELRGVVGSLVALGLAVAIGWSIAKRPVIAKRSGGTLALLIVSILAVGYLRYVAPNPFGAGLGQSWSQFKISDWIHLFVVAVGLSALLPLARAKPARWAVYAICVVGVLSGSLAGIGRVAPMASNYGDQPSVSAYLNNLHQVVSSVCSTAPEIYLDLPGQNHKTRQLVALYLADLNVRGDWTDDGYIYPWLPREDQDRRVEEGDCVVAPAGQEVGAKLAQLGPLDVSIANGSAMPRLEAIGDYGVEGSGNVWWIWVKSTVKLEIDYRDSDFSADLVFDASIASPAAHTLTIVSRLADGTSATRTETLAPGEQAIAIPLAVGGSQVVGVDLSSDGVPQAIGPADARTVTFLLRNGRIEHGPGIDGTGPQT